VTLASQRPCAREQASAARGPARGHPGGQVAVFLVSRFGLGVLASLRRVIVSASEPGSGFGWNSLSDTA
jgi:hypothetical protein